MESAKLVTAGWLAKRWRMTAWIWRLVLVALIAGLAVIKAPLLAKACKRRL
jgi:hypothetical protein